MLGGYKDHGNFENDAGVQGAADFAADKLGDGKLAKILSAKTQVVAGTNYDMQIELTSGKKFQVVVYEPLGVTGPFAGSSGSWGSMALTRQGL
ncbi:hypothetical protein WJX84_003830 [Apatococcus fuscideae]|uniref:Cystatin domain-containing protein n=1 Tax=Apatococcus fuscideae TaxID=2026836 RepID=A0AAW1SQ09_9CHLO